MSEATDHREEGGVFEGGGSCPGFRVTFGLFISVFFNFREYQQNTLVLVESNACEIYLKSVRHNALGIWHNVIRVLGHGLSWDITLMHD